MQVSHQEQAENQPTPLPTDTPIASLWQRFAAWMVDAILLGLAGQALGWLFADWLFTIGPYGRLLGLLIILPYFGLLNSSVGNGQTVGKRLMKTTVSDANGRPITPLRSLARTTLLVLPFLLGGWALPAFENRVFAFLSAWILFGLGGAILYTMIFNRGAQQGFHDLLCQTYVIKVNAVAEVPLPRTKSVHWAFAGVWMLLTAIFLFFLQADNPSYIPNPSSTRIREIQQTLASDPRFFTVTVRDQTITPEKDPAYRSLVIDVWTVGQLPEDSRWEIARRIAGQALHNMKGIDEFDQIQVKLTYGYDIGIASYSSGFWYSNPVEEWRSILVEKSSTGG